MKYFISGIIYLSMIANAWSSNTTITDELISPVTTDAKYVFYTGSLLTVALLGLEDQIIDPLQAETIENKPMGSASKFFDYCGRGIPNALYFLYT